MARILVFFFAIGTLTGCREPDLVLCAPATALVVTPPAPSPPTSNLSLAEFTRRNKPGPQAFHLQFGQSKTVTIRGGATFTFPAATYLLPNGTPADSGVAYVQGFYTVPEMVLANMPTQEAGTQNILISGGEFSIKLLQGSQRLRLAGATLALQTPRPGGQDSTPHQVWSQSFASSANTGVPILGASGWQLNANVRVDTMQQGYRTQLPLDSLSLWNIDQLWSAYPGATRSQVAVVTPASANAADTRVFVRPTGRNGLGLLTYSSPTLYQASLPTGATMQVIVLQSISGQLYIGSQLFTAQAGLTLTPPLRAVSEAEALAFIRQL